MRTNGRIGVWTTPSVSAKRLESGENEGKIGKCVQENACRGLMGDAKNGGQGTEASVQADARAGCQDVG